MTDETPPPDQEPGFWHHVWYWVKLPIWYLIRDTECPYCIFLRGVLLGIIVMGVAWSMSK